MSLFKFRALDSQGVAQSGTLQAIDQAAAVVILQSAIDAQRARER